MGGGAIACLVSQILIKKKKKTQKYYDKSLWKSHHSQYF